MEKNLEERMSRGNCTFAVRYKWRVTEEHEDTFIEDWARGTEKIYETYGSLGSSLHKNEEGLWVGYARWPNREAWERMYAKPSTMENEKVQLVGDPEKLDLVLDYLQKDVFSSDKT